VSSIPGAYPVHPGSLITVATQSVEETARILALTDHLESLSPTEKSRVLTNRRIALLFYESSTRTRTSFELAATSLGAARLAPNALSCGTTMAARRLCWPAQRVCRS